MDARCIPLLLLACFVTYSRNSDIPKFGQSINNLTVPIGREAVLSCVVDDLNTYKVAWLRVDTQTILTIHSHVITKNHRIAVTHSDRRTWYLHIREVQETDRGFYMCQINTDPMKSQIGYLDVVVPPDILDYPTSADMVVREGSNVTLKCAASGSPTPRITWRKEGGELIALNNGQEVATVEGSMLNISRVNRLHMGAYLCIASNGIPPTVSKRIMLIVHFPPMIWIQNQLVGAQIGQSVTLECHSEAYPKSINYWTRENGDIISQGTKYDTEFVDNAYKILMKLTIKSVSASDIITYRCISKNSLGDTDGTIKLYEIPPPTTVPRTTTTPTTTTTRVPEHRGTENKKKVLKPKQETNVNNINNIRITDKSVKSEFTEQRKTSKIATVESGHARTVLHSSSNSRSSTSNHFTTFTTFTTCLILSQHLLSHLKCLC